MSQCQERIFHATCDSRQVKKGSLFFALKGKRVDGHHFLKEVVQRGGKGAIVSTSYRGPSFGLQLIRVEDVMWALQTLAYKIFTEHSPYVIGITGSAGKTTTKEFITTLLSEKFSVAKSRGNMNSQIGLPLTLLNWSGREKMVVLEMGMSKAGEIKRLITLAPPDLAVLTNIHYQHSLFFPDLDSIAHGKCEIFASPKTQQGILSLEVEKFKAVQDLSLSKKWFHLCDSRAHYTLDTLPQPPPFIEKHLQEDFLAAVAVARFCGLSWKEIAHGTHRCKMSAHRFQKLEKRGVYFIDDSYNASPISTQRALANLPKGRRKIALLGAMYELGNFQEKMHKEVGECAVTVLDYLICVGQECGSMIEIFKREGKWAQLFDNKKDATNCLREIIDVGDVVLIKGSNRLKLWTVIEDI